MTNNNETKEYKIIKSNVGLLIECKNKPNYKKKLRKLNKKVKEVLK